jgi:hypothetical protein
MRGVRSGKEPWENYHHAVEDSQQDKRAQEELKECLRATRRGKKESTQLAARVGRRIVNFSKPPLAYKTLLTPTKSTTPVSVTSIGSPNIHGDMITSAAAFNAPVY